MNVDGPEGIGVTADPQKVRPGMIYVDLSCRRNRRKIYEAHERGAYLIFSPYNISDPALPVIKVESPRDTLYMLFEKFFEKQKKHAKLIGIFGESDKSILAELLQGILFKRNDSRIMTDIIPITISANAGNLFYLDSMSFDCTILTDRCSFEVADFISRLSDRKVMIVNNDEHNGLKAAEDLMGISFITYGLNKKAAVTASSIDVDEITCFNYCVQRSFQTRSGKKIEPFEIPVRLQVLGSHNIYNALAAITCGLYYDVDVTGIKESVESYKASSRHFEKIFDGDFTVIDNYCGSLNDYTAAFDSIQILSYEDLVLIISVSQDADLASHEEKAVLIAEWVKVLKCREVILTSCMDGDYRMGELPLRSMRIYKKIFKENDVPFRYYHLLHHAIEKGLSLLHSHDLLVLLGSEEMNTASRMVYKLLKTIKAKYN
ncbi:MAG: Mur ligase family protein [Clostridiaceae bacterium]|nr:Mur ligase family protein [Clostridiaceae bacterium]